MSGQTLSTTRERGQTGAVVAVGGPEHERLVRLSRVMEPHVCETLARLALAPGARVVEFGCGPLGALLPLADAVGPDGTVVGVDRDGAALETAGSIMAERGVGNVRLVRADLAALTPAQVCPPARTDPSPPRPDGPDDPDGPADLFDLAYGHFVLCCQRDVVGPLQRLAATVRPGGYIVAQEVLLTAPIPVETPGRFHRAATLLMNEWLPALLGTMGTCWDVAERYSMLCREAGLVEVGQRTFTPTLPPAQAADGVALYRDILAGVRPLLRRFDIAPEEKIGRTLRDLDLAGDEDYDATVFTHIRVELVARVP